MRFATILALVSAFLNKPPFGIKSCVGYYLYIYSGASFEGGKGTVALPNNLEKNHYIAHSPELSRCGPLLHLPPHKNARATTLLIFHEVEMNLFDII